MGKVIPFLSKEDRRVKEILTKLFDHDITGMARMLPSGFKFMYHRFGPTVEITDKHHGLVLKELNKRGLKVR